MVPLIIPNNSERIFTQICNYNYLKGFVFHSPKIFNPTEQEIGDVLIWIRTLVINFELIWRNPSASSNLKSFVKRIGSKRDQLKDDFEILKSLDDEILLKNEHGLQVSFRAEHFIPENYFGIALIDAQDSVYKLHYATISKLFDLPFRCCFITYQGFIDILNEVDTINDLALYFNDRHKFTKFLFNKYPNSILEMNPLFEKQLIAFYKMNQYKFLPSEWDDENKFSYWDLFKTEFSDKMEERDRQNKDSYIVDSIIEHILKRQTDPAQSPLHAWELGILTRRQRALGLSKKLIGAFEQMKNGRPERYFSFLNQTTGCWLLFYFKHGGNLEELITELDELMKLKTIFEIHSNNFEYSIFGYGFRKSEITLNNTFDDLYIGIDDANKYSDINSSDLTKAQNMFGATSMLPIREFPE